MTHLHKLLLALLLAAGCGDGASGGGVDLAGVAGGDLAVTGARDLAFPPGSDLAGIDLATPPAPDGGGGSVGPTGGSVDRLFFAAHGDTRGPNCDDPNGYPKAIIQSVYQREAALGVQFAVDLGDHMNACGAAANEPQIEMNLYTSAAALLGHPTFMTMGNHECQVKGFCTATDPNLAAYLQALKPIAALPYYSVDIQTQSGLATLVVIADNAWDNNEQQWLQATLTKADAKAKYTIITRHHPIDYLKLSAPQEWQIIQQHKYSLFLVSHSHQYLRDLVNDASGRTVVMGCGGAPLATNQAWYGFLTVKQEKDDRLTVSAYDQASGMVQDSFSVTPQ